MSSTPSSTFVSSFDILVVDDDEHVREGIAELLTVKGHHVRSVGSAREAMVSLEAGKCDLAIIDVCMPRMDGVEFAAMVRMAYPTTHIVLMSGDCPEALRIDARRLRIGEVIRKPFRVEAIDATLDLIAGRLATTGRIPIPAG